MKSVKFWIPDIDGGKREAIIPEEFVKSILARAAEHEAGHIVAAHHLNAHVLGIAVAPHSHGPGVFLQSLYGWEQASATAETQCVVQAAGAAADILFHGGYTEVDVSGDLIAIQNLTGQASLEPFLDTAKSILGRYSSQVSCIAKTFRLSLWEGGYRSVVKLSSDGGGRFGALLLDETQLMKCLSKTSNAEWIAVESDFERVATHEAGHTVVGLSLGAKIDYIERMAANEVPGALQAHDFHAALAVKFTSGVQNLEPRLQYVIAVGGMAAENLIFGKYSEEGAAADFETLKPAGLDETQIAGLTVIAQKVLNENIHFFDRLRENLTERLRASQEGILAAGASVNARFKKTGKRVDVSTDIDRLLPP